MKTIFRIVPVSVCVSAAIILPACDRTDAPVTSVKPVNQQTPAAAPVEPVAAAEPAAAEVPTTAARSTAARPETDKATLTKAGANDLLAANSLGNTANTAAPAGRATDPPKPMSTTHIVKADPAEVDLGEIPTHDSKMGKLKLVNTGDTPMNVVSVRGSCGCTAVKFTPNTVIPASDSLELEVQMQGGAKDGPIHGKILTVVVEGQPEIVVPIKATAVSFVKVDPATLQPDSMPDGKFTLKSADGQPFKVMSAIPQVLESIGTESATEHQLTVSWEKYREIGPSKQMIVYLDHPKCQQVTVPVNFSNDEIRKYQEQLRNQRNANKQAITDDPQAKKAAIVAAQQQVDPDAALAQLVKDRKNVEILQKLQTGLDVNYRDSSGASLLSIAAKEGNVELIKALLAIEKVDKDSTDNVGRTALMHAAGSKNAEAVRVLLDAGSDVDARDNLGTTALSWAAWLGDVDSVQALLDAGSQVEVVSTITGWTPLILAAAFGETESVALLLDAHAEIEAADMLEGATPLIHASRTGKPEAIKLLVQRGANLENPDRNGCTPLLASCKTSGGDAEKVQTLIDLGADVHAKDNRGYNALDLARKRTDIRAAGVIKILEPLLGAETPAAASGEKDPAAGS